VLVAAVFSSSGLGIDARESVIENQDRGFLMIARANAVRCFCPPDKRTPRSPITCQSRREQLNHRQQLCDARRLFDPFGFAVHAPKKNVVAHEPKKEKSSCET